MKIPVSTRRLPALLFLVALCNLPTYATSAEHEHHLQPETVDYALILPANIPHVLRTANSNSGKLGLDEPQKKLVRELMAEAPLKVYSNLQQAEKLEKAIAEDVLQRLPAAANLQPRLDELVRLKREASEAQIATIYRIRAAISEAQFRQLLKLTASADRH